MPELPEVEAARKALHESCCRRTILDATIAEDPIVINGVAPSAFRSALIGRTILSALRKGKNLWLQLDQRPWPTFQFGMTGAFYIKGKEITKYKRSAVSDEEEWPSKFSKVFLKLDDGLEVSFTDKRRLARVRLIDDPPTAPPVSELGADAFLELPDEITLAGSILKKKCPIKALLLDQSFIAGIGNWLADEILYQARIHPEQVASTLSEDDCIELHKCIQKVIKLSVEVDADSERFPKDWIFHYRWNKKPGEVDGKKIEFITVGGRTSAIVPALQTCTSLSSKKANGKGKKLEEKLDNKGNRSKSKKEQAGTPKSFKAALKKGKQKEESDSADVAETSEESIELKVRSQKRQQKGDSVKKENEEKAQSTKKRGRPPARKQEEKHDTDKKSNGKEEEAALGGENEEVGNNRASRKRSIKNVGKIASSPVGTAELVKKAPGRKRKHVS